MRLKRCRTAVLICGLRLPRSSRHREPFAFTIPSLMTDLEIRPIYKRLDPVMVKAREFSTEWFLGVIDKDFAAGDSWVRASVKSDEIGQFSCLPGYSPADVRPATADDIAAAPDFARDWLQNQFDREDQRLHDLRDPRIWGKTKPGTASLRQAGIERVSDLARFTDKELTALPGIGKTAVAQWREQAVELQQAGGVA